MQIESFEKGCEIMGYDPTQRPIVAHLPAIHQKAIQSAYELFVISEASWKADGNEPDFNDESQEKWTPAFFLTKHRANPSGCRFMESCYCIRVASTTSGSRLCYPSKSDSDFHGKQHEGLYRDVMKKGK